MELNENAMGVKQARKESRNARNRAQLVPGRRREKVVCDKRTTLKNRKY